MRLWMNDSDIIDRVILNFFTKRRRRGEFVTHQCRLMLALLHLTCFAAPLMTHTCASVDGV